MNKRENEEEEEAKEFNKNYLYDNWNEYNNSQSQPLLMYDEQFPFSLFDDTANIQIQSFLQPIQAKSSLLTEETTNQSVQYSSEQSIQQFNNEFQFHSQMQKLDQFYSQNTDCQIQFQQEKNQSSKEENQQIIQQEEFQSKQYEKDERIQQGKIQSNQYKQQQISDIEREENKIKQNQFSQKEDTLGLVQNNPYLRNTQFGSKLFSPKLNISVQKKFYLFVDQVIDLEYLKNYKKNAEYMHSNKSMYHYQGLRFISSVNHRRDNKFIEINMHSFNTNIDQIDMIIEMIKSLGDIDLFVFVEDLLDFKRGIIHCQLSINKQAKDIVFIQHQKARQEARDAKLKQLSSEIDQSKYILYQVLSINYTSNKVESTLAAFSPPLYEFIGIDSYTFQQLISNSGYVCPLFQRMDKCFKGACAYLNASPTNRYAKSLKSIEQFLVTMDSFKFPVQLTASRFNLEEEYDNEHGLQFDWNDTLNIYEFTFKEPKAIERFMKYRQEQMELKMSLETIYYDQIDYDQFDFKDTEFFNKYYCDQIDNLIKKGNKWFKRCGYMEIPKKKIKKQSIKY